MENFSENVFEKNIVLNILNEFYLFIRDSKQLSERDSKQLSEMWKKINKQDHLSNIYRSIFAGIIVPFAIVTFTLYITFLLRLPAKYFCKLALIINVLFWLLVFYLKAIRNKKTYNIELVFKLVFKKLCTNICFFISYIVSTFLQLSPIVQNTRLNKITMDVFQSIISGSFTVYIFILLIVYVINILHFSYNLYFKMNLINIEMGSDFDQFQINIIDNMAIVESFFERKIMRHNENRILSNVEKKSYKEAIIQDELLFNGMANFVNSSNIFLKISSIFGFLSLSPWIFNKTTYYFTNQLLNSFLKTQSIWFQNTILKLIVVLILLLIVCLPVVISLRILYVDSDIMNFLKFRYIAILIYCYMIYCKLGSFKKSIFFGNPKSGSFDNNRESID